MHRVRCLRICESVDMAKTQDFIPLTAEDSSANLRGEKLPGTRDGDIGDPKQPGRAPVAVPGSPPTGQVVTMTEREIWLFQAGQAYGQAEVYKRAGKFLAGLAQQYEAAAVARDKLGNELTTKAHQPVTPTGSRVVRWFTERFPRR